MYSDQKHGDWLVTNEIGYTDPTGALRVLVEHSPVGTYAMHLFVMMDLQPPPRLVDKHSRAWLVDWVKEQNGNGYKWPLIAETLLRTAWVATHPTGTCSEAA